MAAKNGHLNCLKYARENGCLWGKMTCSNAAEQGHLDCLKYAHENGCFWDQTTCSKAAKNGHLECLKYAHQNGCPWDVHSACFDSVGIGNKDCREYALKNGCPRFKNLSGVSKKKPHQNEYSRGLRLSYLLTNQSIDYVCCILIFKYV